MTKHRNSKEDAIIRAVATAVLLREAPDEVLLVDSYDPSNALYGKTAKGPSGFGVEAGIALLMPLVWKLAEKLLNEIYGQSISAVAKKILASIVPSESGKAAPAGVVPELIIWAESQLHAEGLSGERAAAVARTFAEAFIAQKLPSP